MSKEAKKSPAGKEIKNDKEGSEFKNSLTSVVESLILGNMFGLGLGRGTPGVISGTVTQLANLRFYLISNNRIMLNWAYVEHGIVQTLIDQPVEDAFRTGFEIKTGQLDADELELLHNWFESSKSIRSLIQGKKWARLFGGGGVLIITGQPSTAPLDITKLNKDSLVEFRAVDMWELYYDLWQPKTNTSVNDKLNSDFYNYYGQSVHPSRVIRMEGKEAPSWVRNLLRGWGMSELERLIRSLNQYMKNQDVIFDLLDEAKIDVFKMKGMNSALASDGGSNRVAQRIQQSNALKNYNNALTMDADDEYQQKQITFSGLSDILTQIRQGLASDLKMPMTKLFGLPAAGFNSGEDDIENYNSMIESEVRSNTKDAVIELTKIGCQLLFGFIPDDLMMTFHPLRILSAKDVEEIKKKQFERVHTSWSSGLIPTIEAKESINKASLLPSEIEENDDMEEPPAHFGKGGDGQDDNQDDNQDDKNKDKDKDKDKDKKAKTKDDKK